MDRITALQQKHSWLTEKQARFILTTRYWKFSRELGMEGATLAAALDNCVHIYSQLDEPEMRNTLARFQEKFVAK